MRIQGASRYKRKVHLLKNAGRKEHVSTPKIDEQIEGPYNLEKAEGGTKSGDRKKPTEQGALTSWRPHREGQVRTQRETDRARGTHFLETTSGGTSQDTERN